MNDDWVRVGGEEVDRKCGCLCIYIIYICCICLCVCVCLCGNVSRGKLSWERVSCKGHLSPILTRRDYWISTAATATTTAAVSGLYLYIYMYVICVYVWVYVLTDVGWWKIPLLLPYSAMYIHIITWPRCTPQRAWAFSPPPSALSTTSIAKLVESKITGQKNE